jgi:uncharacterized membrane protein
MKADNLSLTQPVSGDELAPIFEAVITPHRSLGRNGFLILMAAVAGVSFAAGLVFLVMGAWPVLGFFGLDVLLIYLAFKINYRAAAAYEVVTLTPVELKIRKVSHRGQVREWLLNPLWTRLDKVTHEEFGIERLSLVSRGRRLTVASFLGPDEKASFAKALGRALGEAKRGVALPAPR